MTMMSFMARKQYVTLGGIRADDQLRDALEKAAVDNEVSVSEIHRRALRAYLGLKTTHGDTLDERIEQIAQRVIDQRLASKPTAEQAVA